MATHSGVAFSPRAVAALALIALLMTSIPAHSRDKEPEAGVGVFLQPVGTVLFGIGGGLYLPLGLQVPIDRQTELVLELTPVVGPIYGSGSTTRGGWFAAGVEWFNKRANTRGAFVEAKLILRYFNTSGSQGSPKFDGADYEVHAGLDVGYTFRTNQFETSLLFGLSAGYCGNCFTGSPFYFGELGSLIDGDYTTPRQGHLSLGLNLNILRLGWRF